MDALLDEVYLSPESSSYLAGVNTVYNAAKEKNPNVTIRDVENYLSRQDTHTLHKPTRIRFARNRIISPGVDAGWEVDLMDLQQLKQYNKNNAYVLVCIDQFSKMLWAIPTRTKRPSDVLEAFGKIIDSGRSPWTVYADRGKEWGDIKKWLTERDITFVYATSPDVKCATVERAIRTIKQRMWKHFTRTKSFDYLKILPKIVDSINRTPSRATKHRPLDVNRDNEAVVRSILYNSAPPRPVKHKYKLNQRVRITTERGVFKKGYLPRYSTEVFHIIERLKYRRPATYRLADADGETIDGIFYDSELSAVDK